MSPYLALWASWYERNSEYNFLIILFLLSICITKFSYGIFEGSEIYQEALAKALAKNYGAKLMIVDTLLLPGVNFQLAFYIFLVI